MILLVVTFYPLLVAVYSFSLTDKFCETKNYNATLCQYKRASERISDLTVNSEKELEYFLDEEYRRVARDTADDPSCLSLKDEYDNVCFSVPPVQALLETKAFCDAFIEMCPELLRTNLFTKIKGFRIDFTKYCKKQKERFEYVCPNPLRFHSNAEDAVEFCIRYKERCPDANVPSQPVLFKKTKDRIWTREIKVFCDRAANFAANFCTNPDILKVPKYRLPCGLYKYQCIDIYNRVIYGK